MNKQKKSKYIYSLVDFYLVAFLLCEKMWDKRTKEEYEINGRIENVKAHKTKPGTRVFEVCTEIDADGLIRHFYNGDILVLPKELCQNIRDLKSIIHQRKRKQSK